MWAALNIWVPGEAAAAAVAQACAGRGHAVVAVHGEYVKALVVDPPSPDSFTGFRWQDLEQRDLEAIARAHGGYFGGGSQGSGRVPYDRIRRHQVVHEISPEAAGARRQQVIAGFPQPAPQPPDAARLDEGSSQAQRNPVEVVREISQRIYGDPGIVLRTVSSDDAGAIEGYRENFGSFIADLTDAMMHQGSCYPHTVEEIPLLIALATHDGLAGIHRTLLLGHVFIAASAGLANLPARADQLAARGLDLTETDDEHSVRQAVGHRLPQLWQRWDRESPGARLALAYLAAVYPEQAAPLTGEIRELHGTWPGTSCADGLALCLAIATGDDAVRLAGRLRVLRMSIGAVSPRSQPGAT